MFAMFAVIMGLLDPLGSMEGFGSAMAQARQKMVV